MPDSREQQPCSVAEIAPNSDPNAAPDGPGVAQARSFWAEYLLLTVLIGLFLIRGFIPAWKTLNTDFRNYYVAAWLYRHGSSLLRVYDFTWFQRQKDHAGIGPCVVGYVPDTLLSALPIVPLAGLPPLTAKRVWLVINAGLLALSALILSQITQLGWRRILIVMFLAIDPLAKSFLYGQMHLVVFFLVAATVWLMKRQQPVAGGVSIALAAALKLYPVLFLVFFVRKKQWRAVAGLVAGLVILAGLSVYLFGSEVHRIYLSQILPQMGRGENIDPYAPGWNSLTALLHRAFIREPESNPYPLVHAPEIYALVQPLCQALIFIPAIWLLTPGAVRREHENLEWAAYTAMLIALSTGPTSYHLCILILAAALGLDALLATGRRREACILVGLYGLICSPLMGLAPQNADSWHMLLASPRVYLQLALAFCLYWLIYGIPTVRVRLRTHRHATLAFGAACLLLAGVGAIQAIHHQRNQFDNYARRLFSLPGSLLQGEPAVGANGLYFTRMPGTNERFEAWVWSRTQLAPMPPAEDEFHPTTSPGLKDLWVELAGPVSNIVRFSDLNGAGAPTSAIEIVNGEQPSVSADGKMLAFVREIRGRGEMWIKDLERNANSKSDEERKMVDDSYDVWEAAFEPNGRQVIFVAAPRGQPELFSIDLTSGLTEHMPIPGPARYPSYSPNGQWLAYSRCEHGTWHLYVTDRSFRIRRRVVEGDCNSISPAWQPNSRNLIYATDCGRGLEMTALANIDFSPARGEVDQEDDR
jgi:hypothetical protein